jgi:hypothetical protein
MELVVGVMHEVDLLELAVLGGIESSLFLKEGVFEGGSLCMDRLNECSVIVVKGILECSRISGKTVVESNSLAIEGVGKGSSSISKCSILGGLHVFYNNLHIGKSLINSIFESVLLGVDQCFKFGSCFVVNVCESLFNFLAGVNDLFAEVIHISDEFIDGLAYGTKSCCVSFLEGIVQLVKEFLKSGPCKSELRIKSLSQSQSDVINDG